MKQELNFDSDEELNVFLNNKLKNTNNNIFIYDVLNSIKNFFYFIALSLLFIFYKFLNIFNKK